MSETPAAPTEAVRQTQDGHPAGRHMIDAFRMMATAARTSGGKYQKEIAEVYAAAALCIENEARRADRAEKALANLTENGAALRKAPLDSETPQPPKGKTP